MLYRIFTEDINRKQVEGIVGSKYIGYTLLNATGVWNGQKEKSLIVEIITEKPEPKKVRWIAEKIKSHNNQEAVLIQTLKDNMELI